MEVEKAKKKARAAGDGETAENLRKGKAPRLEPPAAAVEAGSSSGGWASLEASNPCDEADDSGVWEAVAIRDTDGQECDHIVCGMDDIARIESIIIAEEDPMCEDETCLTTGRHLMMVCSECYLYFCIGGPANKAKPRGHIREHAFREDHCVALRYEDPCEGYCFGCGDSLCIEVGMMVHDEEEGCRSSGFANGHGCVIRGIPNKGNTCYLNALLQCLLVLGKLRAGMSRPDAPSGILGGILCDLLDATNSVSHTRDRLDPTMLLGCARMYNPRFEGNFVQDSHELLCCLRNVLDMEEKIVRPGHMQQGAPTVIDSIFGGQLSVTTSCKCCSFKSVSHAVFHDLSVPLPPKGTPAKSVASPPQNERCMSQEKIHIKPFPAVSEGGDSQVPSSESKDIVMVKTSEPLKVDSNHLENISQRKDDVHGPLQASIRKENVMIASGSDAARTNSSVLGKAFNGPEDSIEAKMDTFSAEVTTEEKGKVRNRGVVYDEPKDINSLASIEDCLELHFKADIERRCENCSKLAQKDTAISGKDGEQTVACTSVNRTVDGVQAEPSERKTWRREQCSDLIRLDVECSSSSRQTHGSDAQHQVIPAADMKTKGDILEMSCGANDLPSCSIANKKPECLEGAQEDVRGCCPAENLSNLLAGLCQNASTQDQGMGKEVNLGHCAHHVEKNQYDGHDRNEGAIQTCLISKLPAILVIHLMRNLGPLKVSGHVSFKEIFDVEVFLHPSSEDKDNSRYRLVGVVEHQGLGNDTGHFVAYVRPSRAQQTNGSSSWFRADDADISEISLEKVLKCEAYLLFYERMEG